MVAMVGGDWLWGITGAVLLFFALNRWFLPTTFHVNENQLEVGYPLARRTISWDEVRRVVVDVRGGWISRRIRVSRFNARSGMDLYWGSSPEEDIASIAKAIEQAEASGVPLKFTDLRGGQGE